MADKIKKTATNICFPPKMLEQAKQIAQDKGLSLSGFICLILGEQIKKELSEKVEKIEKRA